MTIKNNLSTHNTWLNKENPQLPPLDLINHVLKHFQQPITQKSTLAGRQSSLNVNNTTSSILPNKTTQNTFTTIHSNPTLSRPDNINNTAKATSFPSNDIVSSLNRLSQNGTSVNNDKVNHLETITNISLKRLANDEKLPNKRRQDLPIGTTPNNVASSNIQLPNNRHAPINTQKEISKHVTITKTHHELSNKLQTQSSPLIESILRQIIDMQDKKINLLQQRFDISESTSISLDAKKSFYHSITPKFTQLEESLSKLQEKLIISSTQINDMPPNNGILSSTQINIPPSAQTNDIPPSPIIEPFSNGAPNNFPGDILEVTQEDFASNINEARDFVLQNRQNSFVQVQESLPNDLKSDEEDHFGEDSMDGLSTPPHERNEIDDLSGFVEPEDSEVDNTFQEMSENSDLESTTYNNVLQDELDQIRVSQDELENIRLSQDVAKKFGIDYNNSTTKDTIEEVIDDDSSIADDEIEEIEDFTTQLNDERELNNEVIEVLSDVDEDFEFDYNMPIKIEKSSPIKPIAQVSLLDSDNDFSDDDDDDELMKIINGAVPIPGSTGREVPAGTEMFIDEVYSALNNVFKLKSFRQNQLRAICSLLLGQDVFVLMPTGGGKSLCYQLPALVTQGKTRGTTIVISPLISLMQDQVDHLLRRGINAGMISSKATKDINKETMNQFRDGTLQLVYLSPEMCNKSAHVQKIIKRLYDNKQLARVVIDEAHCLSSWGHDFRPDYKGMSIFKEQYPDVPLMALTATANEKVKKDIVHHLKMINPILLKQSFNRSNLYYTIKNKDSNHVSWIKDYILTEKRGCAGIIYCSTRINCEKVSESLNSYGLRTSFYHAGMTNDERSTVQNMWQTGELQLICATVAFGMGIDKPDVRFVIHLALPRNLEGYYQETGRAGRDGKQSDCIMLYSPADARSIQGMIQRDKELTYEGKRNHTEKLQQVVQYCNNHIECRRKQVLHYFNENFDLNLCNRQCDNCKYKHLNTVVEKDCTEHSRDIIKLVQATGGERVTLIQCQDIFRGAKTNKIMQMGHHNNPYHGKGKNLEKTDIERIFLSLLMGNYITEYQVNTGGAFHSNYLKLGENADRLLRGSEKIILKFNNAIKSSSREGQPVSSGSTTLSNFRYTESFQTAREVQQTSMINLPTSMSIPANEEKHIEHSYNELNKVRIDVLNELGMLPNQVIGEVGFKDMAIKLPTNKKDFGKLKDITKSQVENFNYFKKVLATLSRDRKKDTNVSPYFNNTTTQAARVALPTPSKAPAYRKKSGKQRSQRPSQRTQKGQKTRKGLPL